MSGKLRITRFTTLVPTTLAVAVSHCPKCQASKGYYCTTTGGNRARQSHKARIDRSTYAVKAVSIGTNSTLYVDPFASLCDMKRLCPLFFSFPHGKRETFTVYRGCLIVRHTVKFTGVPAKRLTAPYLFGQYDDTLDHSFSLVSSLHTFPNMGAAQRVIDEVLERKSVRQALPCFPQYYG